MIFHNFPIEGSLKNTLILNTLSQNAFNPPVFWEGFPDLVEYFPELVPKSRSDVLSCQFWLVITILAVSHVHHLENVEVKEEEEEMEEDDEVEMEGFKSSEGRTYLIG